MRYTSVGDNDIESIHTISRREIAMNKTIQRKVFHSFSYLKSKRD